MSETHPIYLLDLRGNPFDLWQHQKQAVVTVVVFIRTDCPISNRFAPEIDRLCALYQPRGVAFYLIYVDPRETADGIRQHLHDYAYPCGGLRDPAHSLVAYCHATTTPEAVVFDAHRDIVYEGRISDLYVEVGNARPEATKHDLADAIQATLNGRPVVNPRTKTLGCAIADLKEGT